MVKKIVWSSDALVQLEDIHFYIFFESKSILIADKVVESIFESTAILKKQPELFELDAQKSNNDGTFRAYAIFNYKISYRVTSDAIQILRVRHNARKYKAL